MSLSTRARWALLTVVAVAVAGCASPSAPRSSDPPMTSASATSSPAAFEPSASTDLFLPPGLPADAGTAVPVIVLVPGGGWESHDRLGLVPLAQEIADAGYVAATTEYRAGDDGVRFPDTVHDVWCSAAYAVAQAKGSGISTGPVYLIGHSAGGHLAALAAVSGTALQGECADPIPELAGVVGLAGVYDTADFAEAMTSFFGVLRSSAQALWESGDPIHYVETGKAPPGLHVLLLHGDDDVVVPVSQSQSFADALKAAGIDVDLQILPGEQHLSVITVGVGGPPILAWLKDVAPVT